MSTTFAFTFPRRIALSAGPRLVRWARRPETAASAQTRTALNRRVAEVSGLARREALADRRQRDVDRFLSQVRPIL